jgi:lysophospholipase L1-like esterase
MNHIALLGDSIFDNGAYVLEAPDIVRQVRELLSQGSKATLKAIDGGTTKDIRQQLQQLPVDTTHLIVSVGGNDALGSSDFLGTSTRSVAEALAGLANIADKFERNYREMLAEVLAHELPTVICTIYYPRLPVAALQRIAVAALTVFNDCIIRAAVAHKIPLLDLRFICTEQGDYASPFEPSARGGEKIAQAIVRLVGDDLSGLRTRVFV